MTLAFYAPMKSPDHPIASGDRTVARALMAALRRAGAGVTLVSDFQSRDGHGDPALQARLLQEAAAEAEYLIGRGAQAGWRAWVTYHNYYKAPDLLGPAVAGALGIPYVQIEATRAKKRLNGNWARFAQAAEAATDRADLIFFFTARDAEALKVHAPAGQRLRHLRPFLDRETAYDTPPAGAGILTVGMMRERDKLPSYALIADTLSRLHPCDWALSIVGDGPARPRVERLFRRFGPRVRFLGALPRPVLDNHYAHHAIFFWPGVNEAFGMVYLEAQAYGLAVVAQDRPGVRDVLPMGPHPAPQDGAAGLAARLHPLLSEPSSLQEAQAASVKNAGRHMLPAAARTLRAGLEEIGVLT